MTIKFLKHFALFQTSNLRFNKLAGYQLSHFTLQNKMFVGNTIPVIVKEGWAQHGQVCLPACQLSCTILFEISMHCDTNI
jgi:hypothetical protein